jgi:hypothetical protein
MDELSKNFYHSNTNQQVDYCIKFVSQIGDLLERNEVNVDKRHCD